MKKEFFGRLRRGLHSGPIPEDRVSLEIDEETRTSLDFLLLPYAGRLITITIEDEEYDQLEGLQREGDPQYSPHRRRRY